MFNKFCWWLDSNRGPLVSEATALPTEPQPLLITLKSLEGVLLHIVFLKIWAKPGSFLFIFVLFVHYNDKYIVKLDWIWKKCRLCAWDSNPGPQDGRCRRIHWAMSAPNSDNFWFYFPWAVVDVVALSLSSPLSLIAAMAIKIRKGQNIRKFEESGLFADLKYTFPTYQLTVKMRRFGQHKSWSMRMAEN